MRNRPLALAVVLGNPVQINFVRNTHETKQRKQFNIESTADATTTENKATYLKFHPLDFYESFNEKKTEYEKCVKLLKAIQPKPKEKSVEIVDSVLETNSPNRDTFRTDNEIYLVSDKKKIRNQKNKQTRKKSSGTKNTRNTRKKKTKLRQANDKLHTD